MNLHLPQSLEATAELSTFMNVTSHIVSAQNNAPIIAIIQDGLLGSYILSQNTTLVPKRIFFDSILSVKNPQDFQEFLKRAIKVYPEYIELIDGYHHLKENVIGKLLLSYIIPPKFNYYKKTDTDSNSPIVLIKDGIILPESGPLCKKVLGNKGNSIGHYLFNEFSHDIAADFLSNIQFIINRWFPSKGFSIGISDCLTENNKEIDETLAKAKVECDEKITIGGENLEQEINFVLSSTLNVGLKLTQEGMSKGKNNAIVIMYKSGAKGNHMNCSQIAALLGQQNIRGHRIPKMLSNSKRSLPHFEVNDESPEARGFIDRPYLSGLNPQNTYFHAMAGREGLIDTSTKTSESGYLQRRIVKKLEDLKVHYDGTVRFANNHIVQFLYGDDGWDASRLYNDKEGKLTFIDIDRIVEKLNM